MDGSNVYKRHITQHSNPKTPSATASRLIPLVCLLRSAHFSLLGERQQWTTKRTGLVYSPQSKGEFEERWNSNTFLALLLLGMKWSQQRNLWVYVNRCNISLASQIADTAVISRTWKAHYNNLLCKKRVCSQEILTTNMIQNCMTFYRLNFCVIKKKCF